jgi:hypothetical protein
MCGYLRHILLLFLILWPFLLSSQTVSEWSRFQSTGNLGINHRKSIPSGQVLSLEYTGTLTLMGSTLPPHGVSIATALCFIDSQGAIQWWIQAYSTDNTTTTDLLVMDDLTIWTGTFWDELLIGDTTLSISRGSTGIFIAGINNQNGSIDWIQVIEGDSQKQSAALTINEDGIIYNLGTFRNNLFFQNGDSFHAPLESYLYVCALDLHGNIMATAAYGGQAQITIADAVALEGKIFVTGSLIGRLELGGITITARIIDSDLFFLAFNQDLNAQWAQIAGGIFDKTPVQMQMADGKLVILGHFLGPMRFRDGLSIQTNGFNTDGFIAVIRPLDGYPLEAYTINGPGNIFPEQFTLAEGFVWVSGIWIGDIIDPNGNLLTTPEGQPYGFVLRMDKQYVTKELLQIQAVGLLSDLIILPTTQGLTLSLNFNDQWQFVDQNFESAGQFEGIILLFETISSTSSVFQKDPFTIYPNPVYQDLFWTDESIYEYQIIDNNGRILRRGKAKQSLIIQDLHPGIYILQLVSTEDKTITTQRFLKL